MKIAIVGDYPLDFPQGGVQTHFFHLSSYLSSYSDLEVHIITLGEVNLCIKKSALTIHVIKRLINIPRIFSIFFDCWQLRNEIHKVDPDVVHIQATYYPYGPLAAIISDEYTTVLTVHGIMAVEAGYHNFPFAIEAYVAKFLEKVTLAKIKHIIVVSPQTGDIIRSMTKANIYVVPNGIDIEFIDSIEPCSKNWKNTILFIGNLLPLKGVDILINAVALVHIIIPDIKLYIAGSGPQEEELKKLVRKLGLLRNVEFLGYLNGRSKYAYIKSTNIMVVPSLWESLPIVVLEGMACRKPVVASNVGGIPYLIKNNENGVLVDACDIESLAEKIFALLQDEILRERMGEEGFLRSKMFSWDKIALDTLSYYKEIFDSR